MIDNHVHLDLINDNISSIIERAKRVGVTEFIVPGVCGFPKRLEELQRYSEIKICWGIYPQYAEVEGIFEKELVNLKASQTDLYAIGECGLDKRFPNLEKQISLFKKQLILASQINKPLIIHLVGYYQKALDLLKESSNRPEFILHSWSGSAEMAKEFVKLGGKISLSGGILKSPKKLKEILDTIPSEKIIFETDSPDQKPDFVETEQNEPANLPRIIEAIRKLTAKQSLA
jgi:TatD DNase family protein